MKNQLFLLGTGTPNACFDAMGPSVALLLHGRLYVVDAGAGVVRQCSKLYQRGFKECTPQNLDTLFLTHLHSDHTVGLADFILTPWVLERDHPCRIYGPTGTEQMVQHLLEAYQVDIDFRLHGFEKANPYGYQCEVHPVSGGTVYQDDLVTVDALAVQHGLESYAYRFRFDGCTVVISGDTCYLKEMAEFAKDADVLIHEVYYTAGLQQRTAKWQKYHQSVHTSSYDLAKLLQVARPKKCITTHRIFHMDLYNDDIDVLKERHRREQAILDEIKQFYDGEVVHGHDLDVIELSDLKSASNQVK